MKKNVFGFTLIELIIAVTVVMVLTGVGAMSLNNFNDIKELESIRAEVSNHIKLAKNLALTKQLPDNTEIGNLEYVRVTFLNNEITIEGVNNIGVIFSDSPYSKMKINAKSGVNITSANFGFLKSTGRLTDSSGIETSVAIVVSLSRGTNTRTININNLGIISYGN